MSFPDFVVRPWKRPIRANFWFRLFGVCILLEDWHFPRDMKPLLLPTPPSKTPKGRVLISLIAIGFCDTVSVVMATKKVSPKTEWARDARVVKPETAILRGLSFAQAGEGQGQVPPLRRCLERRDSRTFVRRPSNGTCASNVFPSLQREFRGRPVTRCQVCLDRAVVRREAWLSPKISTVGVDFCLILL